MENVVINGFNNLCGKDKRRANNLIRVYEIYNIKNTFKPGDLVKWKPNLCPDLDSKFAIYSFPLIIHKVVENKVDGNGVPLDILIASSFSCVDKDDFECETFDFEWTDSNRLMHYNDYIKF